MKAVLCLLLVACACAGGTASGQTRGQLQVAAAENFWGSVASQLGGRRMIVKSVISNPATDPHDYEPTAADARTLAGAQFVIVNGIGYDPWAGELLAANPVHGRVVLTVGDLLGIEPGGNPHQWYSPGNVRKVIAELVRDYTKLDPKDAGYFRQQQARFETRGLAKYNGLIATIRRRYHDVPVGASESVFEPLAEALRLRLATPPSFLKAISEGTEPTAADKATIDRQIAHRQIKVWVFNSQNSTPDVKRITDAARNKGIAIATITETLTPPSASFQDWQSHQLQALAS